MIKYKQGTLTNQRFLAKIQDKFWFCRWNSRVNDGIFANSSVVTIFLQRSFNRRVVPFQQGAIEIFL